MSIYKACSRCGKLHKAGYRCAAGRDYSMSKTDVDNMRNTRKWHNKSAAIKAASQYLCAACRAQGIYTYDNLEVHHIIKLRDAPDKLLDDDNLVCLCQNCHTLADAGLIEADYLRKLAAKRDEDANRG